MEKYVVIGAGILGASTAYHLAKDGKSVTIIDREEPGQATNAAAGIICPWLSQRRNKAWYFLAKKGAAYYHSLIQQLENDGEQETGYQQTGAISVDIASDKIWKMVERAIQRRETAPEIGDIRQLSEKETKALFPPIATKYASVHVSGAARVDGRLLRLALLAAAKKHGAKWIAGNAALDFSDGQVTAVTVNETRLEADRFIITAGAWAPELVKPLGMELKITPQKAQIIHLQLENEDTGGWPVVMPPNAPYIVTFADGKVVMGATHENDMGFDRRPTLGGMQEIIDKGLELAPGLADATFLETKVGFRPVAPNFLPIIGAVPGFENLYLANGLGSSGLTVGPYLGYQLAKLATGKELDIDLALYNLSEAITKDIS